MSNSQHSAMAELDLSQIFFNICKKKTKQNWDCTGIHLQAFFLAHLASPGL